MKSAFQILFFVLIAIFYFLAFVLIWVGVFPSENFGDVISRWPVLAPAFVLLAPLITFVIFTLGYDPRNNLLRYFRGILVNLLQSMPQLTAALGTLVVLIVAEGVLLTGLTRTPKLECLELYLDGDYENAVNHAEGREKGKKGAALVALVSEAEIEANRRLSTSDNHNAIERLRSRLLDHDDAFDSVWSRFLANYGLGKLAFARKDANELELRFATAGKLAKWTDQSLAPKCMFATAQAFFSLSQAETDTESRRDLLLRAKRILQKDPGIASQRLLGSICYIEKDYGGAFRTWKAILDRTENSGDSSLEVPDADERKNLINNMALARLEQGQPQAGLELVLRGLAEPWDTGLESDRTGQVRLMAAHILCLLSLNRSDEALQVFENRAQVSSQLRSEGLTPGSLLLKANILSAVWKNLGENHSERPARAKELLNCLLLAQEPGRDLAAFQDHSKTSYKGLIANARSLWRWHGISFDEDGCETAILSLIP